MLLYMCQRYNIFIGVYIYISSVHLYTLLLKGVLHLSFVRKLILISCPPVSFLNTLEQNDLIPGIEKHYTSHSYLVCPR